MCQKDPQAGGAEPVDPRARQPYGTTPVDHTPQANFQGRRTEADADKSGVCAGGNWGRRLSFSWTPRPA
eukprot:15437268-Alexandrium_andersonii.AAC.1